ncbi:MAG: MFS transporter [Chloroflexi bacterium]|nr:MFS transporter [Chloroflexota bacterium]
MIDTLRSFRSFDYAVQVLLANNLITNVAFFLLVPFLASYMADGLGLAAWTVGLVLGIRTLSQQGLYPIGGSVADRLGCKPAIVVGAALRVVGFAMFGIVGSAAGMLAASIVTGLAGALLIPATRAYLAQESGDRRVEAFALFNVGNNVGSLLGPLLGTLLLGLGFQAVSLASALLFLGLTVFQLRYLPAREVAADATGQGVLGDWLEVMANRPFVLFSIAMLGNFALFNQVYLGLPLEIRRLTGSDASIGLLFAVMAIVGIVGQLPVTRWCNQHLRPQSAIAVGLAVTGLAFAPLLVTADVLPVEPETARAMLHTLGIVAGQEMDWVAVATLNLAPVLIGAALLSLGTMMSAPFVMGTIASLARGRLVGTYFGMYSLGQGIGATLGNLAAGLALDLAEKAGAPALPWILMTAIGLASALGIVLLDRRRLLAEHQRRPRPAPAT